MATTVVLRNRYRILERLGQGGGGTVFMVADLLVPGAPPLALKAVLQSESHAYLETLKQEFRARGALHRGAPDEAREALQSAREGAESSMPPLL